MILYTSTSCNDTPHHTPQHTYQGTIRNTGPHIKTSLLETLTPGRRLVYVSSIELRGADICRYVSHNPQFNSRHEHIFILLEQVLDWATRAHGIAQAEGTVDQVQRASQHAFNANKQVSNFTGALAVALASKVTAEASGMDANESSTAPRSNSSGTATYPSCPPGWYIA